MFTLWEAFLSHNNDFETIDGFDLWTVDNYFTCPQGKSFSMVHVYVEGV